MYCGEPEIITRIMEDRESLYKGKKVVMWLRFGYTFSKKGRVGYDFAMDDEDLLKKLMYGSHSPVSQHRRSVDLENS